jgi:predicted AAA+ superfamily ATPase
MKNYKDKLIEFVEEFWRKELPILKEREIKVDLETDLINDIIGVRRAGKSSLMILTIGKLGKEKSIYINFENRKLLPLTEKYFDAVIELIYERDLLNKFKKLYLFLDEVQRIEGWERYVRSIYDEFKGKIKIFISGSTSKLTASKLSYLLSGRHLTTYVFPLSFREFLSFKNFKIPKFFVEEDRAKIFGFLKEYIEFGGFPEVVLSNKKEEMLETLMLDIINRDVLPYVTKRKEVVEDFVYFLCSNSGKLLSFNKMAKLFTRVSVVTAQKIFELLRDVLLFFDFPFFSPAVKAQLQYPRKIVCVDSGFINQFGFKFSEDKGRLIRIWLE